jgi:predicted AAA+ superfamily ATPase
MRSLKQLCTPRESVFDTQRRDTVLDLIDLIGDKINPSEFFEENFVTEGMKTLLEQSFRRLEGKSNQGIFKLKQAMGGGKTHNLLTLGLLARYPEFREQVMGKFYKPDSSLGKVRVVAFSGRESDAPLGFWGAIAEQMENRDHFKDLYSPLRAPGQTAWETLLAGETVLILLDELPPYFDNARSISIGDSNLARVTATALSNLLIAMGRESCSKVCLVITDLVGSYESGSEQISEILSNLEKETHRTAMSLEPVRMNSDELYHILRKRIFENIPGETAIIDVAQAYAKAIRDAKQMDITNESPEQFASRIQIAYPFHPAIRDLYARFKENPGFQQTRGLIRLMRIVVSRL